MSDEALRNQLGEIERMLTSNPGLADQKARELLEEVPEQPVALAYRGVAQRLLNQPGLAIDILAPLCESWPEAPFPRLQLGLAYREAADNENAVKTLRDAVQVKPDYGDAWLALADLLATTGRSGEADDAYARYIPLATANPVLREAAAALGQGRGPDADELLQRHLSAHPNDVVALCMLADAMERRGEMAKTRDLLRRALQLAPGYTRARHNHAVILLRQNRLEEALSESARLLGEIPGDREIRKLRAAILVRLQEYEEAIALCEALLAEDAREPAIWTSLGHMLKSVGRRDDAIEAYRKAIELAPGFGEPYWSLANLKTYRVTDAELDSMRASLGGRGLAEADIIHFNFAMGRTLEDRGDYEHAFSHYAEANRLRLATKPYDPQPMADHVKRCQNLLTAEFFAKRQGSGSESAEPIFIVGLPRSGSTLVEQILASHSKVEGTAELPHIPAIASSLETPNEFGHAESYTAVLANLNDEMLSGLGEAYLQQSRKHRKLLRPHFVDKMPNNFAHVGLIQLVLPNAIIIDVRRHPLACGLSVFKEHFAGAQNFGYSLDHIGRYYRNYIDIMSHFDAVLPGRVYRVIYESLVEDTENEVRRLLNHCGLPFEESCLAFHRTDRPVNTASSEQVRQPIYKAGLAHWRNFEPWLGALESALGDALARWNAPPKNLE